MSYTSKGTGRSYDLAFRGADVVIEDGVRIFHPDRVRLAAGVYVGHDAILEGYHKNELVIGEGTWIGARCHLHAAGGILVGRHVGIGPGVRVLTSVHREAGRATPILRSPLRFAPVVVEDDADLGAGCIVLPGVRVGRGAQIGAGAVVSADVQEYAVAAGVPARVIRYRDESAR